MATGPQKFVNVNKNLAASNVLVAGVTGRKLRIKNMILVAEGDVTVTIEDSAGTDLIGPMAFPTNGGVVVESEGEGWQETGVGNGLNLLLSAAVQVGGSLSYQVIK